MQLEITDTHSFSWLLPSEVLEVLAKHKEDWSGGDHEELRKWAEESNDDEHRLVFWFDN